MARPISIIELDPSEENELRRRVSAPTTSKRENLRATITLDRAKGGRPDRYIVQSWYTLPDRTEFIPESQPSTFMWLVKEVIFKTRALKP